MHNDLRQHAREEELEQADGEGEAGPVVAVLHHVETVPLEVDLAVKVHLVEGLHGDLASATVPETIGFVLEVEIVLDALSGILRLLVLARRETRGDGPEGHEDGEEGEDGEEDPCLPTTTDSAREVEGYQGAEREEKDVGEGLAAGGVGGQRSIFDGRVLTGRSVGAQLGQML